MKVVNIHSTAHLSSYITLQKYLSTNLMQQSLVFAVTSRAFGVFISQHQISATSKVISESETAPDCVPIFAVHYSDIIWVKLSTALCQMSALTREHMVGALMWLFRQKKRGLSTRFMDRSTAWSLNNTSKRFPGVRCTSSPEVWRESEEIMWQKLEEGQALTRWNVITRDEISFLNHGIFSTKTLSYLGSCFFFD